MRQERERPVEGNICGKSNDCISRIYKYDTALCQGLVEADLRALGTGGRNHAVTRELVAHTTWLGSQDGKRASSKILERERVDRVIRTSVAELFIPGDSDKGDFEIRGNLAEVTCKGAGCFRSIRGARRYIDNRRCENSGQIFRGGFHGKG